MMRPDELETKLRERLSPERFRHSKSVAELAHRLAEKAGTDPQNAWIAGLLHDAAKELPPDGRRLLLERESPHELADYDKYPALWHALASAILAQKDYNVADPEILSVIRHHPTGHASFGPLGHAVFVADYCEPHQGNPDHEALTKQALCDLRAAARGVIRRKIEYLWETGRSIHPAIVAYWNALVSRQTG
jgi:predicted HD superfamily hydrolase involved in NAD metabolism